MHDFVGRCQLWHARVPDVRPSDQAHRCADVTGITLSSVSGMVSVKTRPRPSLPPVLVPDPRGRGMW